MRPICPFQQKFESLYLFGAFSPINGKHFLLEMPSCNSDTFQIFLHEFSQSDPLEYKIMILDNGAFHKAKRLNIPKNIGLIFLPPYSPELNPAEKVWAKFKRDFTNKLFKSLDELDVYISHLCTSLTDNQIKSLCSFEYIFFENIWINI